MLKFDFLRHTSKDSPAESRSTTPSQPDAPPRRFDLDFYRRFYLDLAHLDAEACARHFVEMGASEGRFANSGEMVAALVQELGPLPDDFDPDEYRAVNADLAGITERDRLTEHYLRFGRTEKRVYLYDIAAYESAYQIHGRDLDAILGARPKTFRQFLRSHGITSILWLGKFNLGQFWLLNADWLARAPRTRIEGLCLFASQGIERIAPIAAAWRFDPDFYRSSDRTPAEAAPADLYRHWLNVGEACGEAGNEEAFLLSLIGESQFPTCFDADAYRATVGEHLVPSERARALAHYVGTGLPEGIEGVVAGAGSASLYAQIARHHAICSRPALALLALDHAVGLAPTSGPIRHARGDALNALNRPGDAVAEFRSAAAQPNATVWSHIHAAEGLAFVLDDPGAALEQVLRSAPIWHGSAPWRALAHRVLDCVFEADGQHAHKLYLAGRRAEADALVEAGLTRISAALALVDPLPGRLPLPPDGPVVIIANRDLAQCDHYRVTQKYEQLQHGGWQAEIYDHRHVDAFRPALNRARAVIFYRVAARPAIMHAILYARALGVPTIYEIDDLIFDAAVYPDPWDSFEGQITPSEYAGLQHGVPLFRYAIGLCDTGLVSTPALAEAMAPLVRSGDCHVLRNGLDARNASFLAATPHPLSPDAVTIFYGSGTKAHNQDFTELAAPGLLSVLKRHPHVHLLVAGHLRLDDRFIALAAQVHRVDFTQDTAAYWEVLSGVDINIAVLAPGTTTDAKSEIKWLEAAVSAVPSIVSATRTYREVLTNGYDALLVDTPDAWQTALESLIADPARRRRIGLQARVKAQADYSLDAAVTVLTGILPAPVPRMPVPGPGANVAVSDAQPPRSARSRPRLLFVHVFFPPDLLGGATRVLRDNVDYLIDHAGDEMDIAVVATDLNATTPYQTRVDAYRGLPVYRIADYPAPHMDWRPFNPQMRAPFEALLDRFDPDLVHIHCIQRLTATVVEVLRDRKTPYFITLHDAWWISDHQFLLDADEQLHLPNENLLDISGSEYGLVRTIARRRQLHRLLTGAHTLLSVSETFAEIHRRAGLPGTQALSNGVSRFTPAPRVPHTDRRVRLGHIGNRSAHKGATLIEAVLRQTQFDNLALTMVEHGREAGYVREEVWGTTPVRLVGPVAQENIADLYAGLDVLLAPSLWPESYGLVTREALAAGLWVIASDRGAVGEDIREGVNGHRIDVSDAAGLRTALAGIEAAPAHYRMPPPTSGQPLRTSDDQGANLLALYRSFFDAVRAAAP